ncbi:MAG: MFS transporter permease, partial [Actinobacteria bacterium]|nr:MFS transporter permease [Actinomycetota bacterium]
AVVRRGTFLAEPLLQHPWALHASQYGVVTLEVLAPLLLVLRGRARDVMLAVYASFHLVTFATIGIIFLPHLVAMLVFLPLERLPVATRRQLDRTALSRVT